MSFISRLRSLWRNLMRRSRVERELDDEVRGLFDLLVDEKMATGVPREEAQRAATIELGRVESIKSHVREVRTGAWWDTFLQDVRYGVRLLWRSPVFTLTATLSLAIGIGANTTIFTVANALLFRRPSGIVEPERLVDIGRSHGGGSFSPNSYPNYLDLRDRTTTLEGTYAYPLFPQAISLGGTAKNPGAARIFGTTGLYVYLPLQQEYLEGWTMIVARSTRGQRLTDDIRRLVANVNPNLPVMIAQTAEDYTALGLMPQRVAVLVAGSLGLVGLLLAAIGIYGVTAYAVSSRTREIGIRVAMGARRVDVLRLVLRQSMALVLIGGIIGLLLAAGGSRLLTAWLFGVSPLDPLTFSVVAVLFALIGLAGCYVPVRRAMAINAAAALRYE